MRAVMRRDLGWALVVMAGIFLSLFVIALSVVRFGNPKLTETELMLWTLHRWWAWAPVMVVGGVGCWMIRD